MMNEDRMQATLEDLAEVQSIAELDIYEALLAREDGGDDPLIQEVLKNKREILSNSVVVLAQYLVELEELRKDEPQARLHFPKSKSSRSYRLLSTGVDWSTTPQVHAIMQILSSIMSVGDVLGEDEILEAMEANVSVLNTRQGGKKIWDYYKGKSDRGLMAHGNIELA